MKHIFALVLSIVLCFSLVFPVSAAEVPSSTPVSANDSGISTYPFSRKYENYYSSNSLITIMEDPNLDIFDDTTVTISVQLSYKNNDEGDWITSTNHVLTLKGAASWSIPENSRFKITGVLISGETGYATFHVSLD